MHPDPTRIRRGPVLGFLLSVAVLFLLAIISMGAQAQPATSAPAITPGYTACGAEAVGRDPHDGKVIKGAFARRFVAPSGIWGTCQPWVPDGGDPAMPEPPTPIPPCAAETVYRTWEVAGLVCTSTPPGDSTSTTMMLPRTEPGRVALLRDDHGAAQGLLVMRCVVQPDRSVRWVVEGQTCGLVPQVVPAGQCAAQAIGYVSSRTRPATAYVYAGEPVATGARVPVRAADGTVRVARCGALGRLEW